MDKLRVLHVIESSAMNGSQKLLLDLIKYNDFEISEVAVYTDNTNKENSLFLQELLKSKSKVFFYNKDMKWYKECISFYKILKSFKPTVIHYHHGKATGKFLALCLYRKAVKTLTLHDDLITFSFQQYSSINSKFFKTIIKMLPNKKWRNYKNRLSKYDSIEDFNKGYKGVSIDLSIKPFCDISKKKDFFNCFEIGFKIFSLIIYFFKFTPVAVSQSVKDSIEYSGIANNIILNYNGVDISNFNKKVNREDNNVRIIHIGAFNIQKNQELLINSFKNVLQTCPNAKLIFVGDGNNLRLMMKKAVKLGISDNIEFLGLRNDIPDLLANSDILVLCSNFESFGLVLVEAMCTGLPVIGTRVGGITEIIREGVDGLLVKAQNAEALTEAIIKLANNKDLRDKLGKAGIERSRQFNIRNTKKNYDGLYLSLIKKARSKGEDII